MAAHRMPTARARRQARRRLALVLATIGVAGCTGSAAGPAPSTTAPTAAAASIPAPTEVASSQPSSAAASVAPTATPGPVRFTSALYGYSIVLPAGWYAAAAILRWEGSSQPGSTDPTVDKFGGPGTVSAFGFAGPVAMTLAAFTKDRIAATARDHGDTCPATPEVNEPISIGGQPGVVLKFNCGILINQAITIVDGVGYSFVLRDSGIAAASDARDESAFTSMLAAVTFP